MLAYICILDKCPTYSLIQDISRFLNAEVGKTSKASVGAPLIGGSFDLLNDEGKKMTDKDLLGKFVIYYFGFTHCPDICPDELEKLSEAINICDKKIGADKLQPVFVSIDPERDTVPQVYSIGLYML